MQVSHLGLTPVKGLRHQVLEAVDVDADGLRGDRLLALAEADSHEILRTVRHPELSRLAATWDEDWLSVVLPDGARVEQRLVRDEPAAAFDPVVTTFWHHRVPATLHDGDVAQGLSEIVGRPVRIARTHGRRFRWADPVALVLRSEVAELALRTGRPELVDQPTRWRGSMVLDDREAPVEVADLLGARLQVVEVVLEVTGEIDRCAVMDTHPVTGRRDVPALAALAAYRRTKDGIMLGVRARVVRGGRLRVGDRARLLPA